MQWYCDAAEMCWELQVARKTGEQCMNFVQHPEQLRETVQHRVGSVVHQADGILHSPRRSSQTRQVLKLGHCLVVSAHPLHLKSNQAITLCVLLIVLHVMHVCVYCSTNSFILWQLPA